jgi:hypothetical protein
VKTDSAPDSCGLAYDPFRGQLDVWTAGFVQLRVWTALGVDSLTCAQLEFGDNCAWAAVSMCKQFDTAGEGLEL